jgi:hypothetical protein
MATFYSQLDPRWKNIPMRGSITIGSDGCFLTCLAYVFSSWSGLDITPDMVLAYAKSQSLLSLKGEINWEIVSKMTNKELKATTDPKGAKYIMAYVKLGKGHLVGYRKSDNTITDPLDGKRKAASPFFKKYPVISWRYII